MKPNNKKGFILLEAVIALTVFVMVVLAIFPMLSFLLKRTAQSQYGSAASVLMQEGIEVAYNAMVTNWNCCTIDGNYKVVYSLQSVNLASGTEVNLLETRFTRTIMVEKVCRDTKGNIIQRSQFVNGVCPANLDKNSRIVTTTISWQEANQTKKISSQLMVINMQENQ